jgi:hypothetical protein
VDIKWHSGLRYPHLERVGAVPTILDAAMDPKRR